MGGADDAAGRLGDQDYDCGVLKQLIDIVFPGRARGVVIVSVECFGEDPVQRVGRRRVSSTQPPRVYSHSIVPGGFEV